VFGGVDNSPQDESLVVDCVADLTTIFDPIWWTVCCPDNDEFRALIVFGYLSGETLLVPVLPLSLRLIVNYLRPATEERPAVGAVQ
jgi:hypothetical protein